MKTSKKIICLVLTFLMAFSVCVPAFAADNDNGVGVTNVKTFNDVADTVYDSADCLDADGDHGELAANIILPGISQSISTLVDENGDPILDGSGKKTFRRTSDNRHDRPCEEDNQKSRMASYFNDTYAEDKQKSRERSRQDYQGAFLRSGYERRRHARK